MASQRLSKQSLSTESEQIISIINENKNFLLSGGAGSGKTHSLIEVINILTGYKPPQNIACITFTNAAAKEITDRFNHPNLHVSTIHDFLWRSIRHFQNELKKTIVNLLTDNDFPKFKLPQNEQAHDGFYDNLTDPIQYKEYVKFKNGIISHDELIVISLQMFLKYKKLRTITSNNYLYILVDEYQDTAPEIIQILVDLLSTHPMRTIVGFFGDSMQSIYDGSIGNLQKHTTGDNPVVKEVIKTQNRRNPKLIIDLANKIRTDSLVQTPSCDIAAPNMNSHGKIKEGTCRFLYSDADSLDTPRNYLAWNFDDSSKTKELNLTHNLIAKKAGFDQLIEIYDNDKILKYVRRVKIFYLSKSPDMDIEGKTFKEVVDLLSAGRTGRELKSVLPTPAMTVYIDGHEDLYLHAQNTEFGKLASMYVDKDQLIDDVKNDYLSKDSKTSKRDDLIKHLYRIQHCIELFKNNSARDFIKFTDFRISTKNDINKLKLIINELENFKNKSIEQIIKDADRHKIVRVDDRLKMFMQNKDYVYKRVAALPYIQFENLYRYIEGHTPFSTQHKTKGLEYNNVLIILDNGNWNNYNFEYLFTERKDKESVVQRTRKIFYVCCTRAKENLAVFYHHPQIAVIKKAKEWFGDDNVINLDK